MKQTNYLSTGNTNAKTRKNLRTTLILYLAPHLSLLNYFAEIGEKIESWMKVNLCPWAGNCSKVCLYTSGMAGVYKSINLARINRTIAYHTDRPAFLQSIANQITRTAAKTDTLAVRLNGTSDIKLMQMLTDAHKLPDNVVFYDYSKNIVWAGERIINGFRYVVTYSRDEKNEEFAIEHLRCGGIVSVVFADSLPSTWHGFPVFDGDERDDLMLDVPQGSVLGLKAKGKARNDCSGFVVK